VKPTITSIFGFPSPSPLEKKTQQQVQFVEVIIPIALPKPYTYHVPAEFQSRIQYGIRVEVQFGKSKRYAAIIVSMGSEAPAYKTKSIIDIIDDTPVITRVQFAFWLWMSEYYCCTIGEVMNAALPSSMKLSSETRIYLIHPPEEEELSDLPGHAQTVLEALSHRSELTLDEIRKLLEIQSVLPIIHLLFARGYVAVKEELIEAYKPKIEKYLKLAAHIRDDDQAMHEALNMTQRSEKQTQALLHLFRLTKNAPEILQKTITEAADVDSTVIKALEKKGIVEITLHEENRIFLDEGEPTPEIILNADQEQACAQIRSMWDEKHVVLLHGVTGSGKTWVYQKLLHEAQQRGQQTLYLLPEIALTVQVVQRLRKIFGNQIVIAHSALSNNERVDLWKRVMEGAPFILGVRSSVFLPFKDLGVIVVDEEHDSSFKQADPAPRYHGRDAAIYLATLWDARVLLGSATPSVETFYNATKGKYGYVEMRTRYMDVRMPDMHFVDLRKHRLAKNSQFSQVLVDGIRKTLDAQQQVIIFKNRRGYAPLVKCQLCGWHATCDQCDVSMTYHKFNNNLHCHLCGTQRPVPIQCPACGSPDIILEGFGTQKIEDELKEIFPKARVARLDFDSTRSKFSYQKIIDDFERKAVDILVGTQMVTKGLDFDHVGLVGVVHADQQLYFPHFRALERTFQLLVQVSGRAGRKETPGNVIVQTYNPTHAVFADVGFNDYLSFYNREIAERERWAYPPFVHLIKITVKHPDRHTVRFAAIELAKRLRLRITRGVLGPAEPRVGKVRNQYIMNLGLKIGRVTGRSSQLKAILLEEIMILKRQKGMTTIRVNVDVDPG
jgi:primosomal protein N' (replication factor Y)